MHHISNSHPTVSVHLPPPPPPPPPLYSRPESGGSVITLSSPSISATLRSSSSSSARPASSGARFRPPTTAATKDPIRASSRALELARRPGMSAVGRRCRLHLLSHRPTAATRAAAGTCAVTKAAAAAVLTSECRDVNRSLQFRALCPHCLITHLHGSFDKIEG